MRLRGAYNLAAKRSTKSPPCLCKEVWSTWRDGELRPYEYSYRSILSRSLEVCEQDWSYECC